MLIWKEGAVADGAGHSRDLGTRCELAGAVVLEQVGRCEDLGVLGEVADLVAGAADAAAGGEHAAVREQQCSRVVLAGHRLGREGRPLTGRGVPALRVVDAPVHVDQRRPVELPPVASTLPSASNVRLNWRRPKAIGAVGVTCGVAPLVSITTALFEEEPPPATSVFPMS